MQIVFYYYALCTKEKAKETTVGIPAVGKSSAEHGVNKTTGCVRVR